MNNPFQEQLLKAGLVSKEQVNKVNQEKRKSNKQQRQKGKKKPVIDEKALKLKQQAEKKSCTRPRTERQERGTGPPTRVVERDQRADPQQQDRTQAGL